MVEVAASAAVATAIAGDKPYEVNGQVAAVRAGAVVRSAPRVYLEEFIV